jgi:glycosyltransferase involved in cell wall biosynthesis
MPGRRYVLVTAAKNEADLIEHPLDSIVRQTLRPLRWVIVSDGSQDATDEIVRRYQSRHDYIELRRIEHNGARSFRSKAAAINHCYDAIKDLKFDYIGNLDADVGLEPTYYAEMLRRFEADPRLGVGGGTAYDLCAGMFRRLPAARDSVPGPFQLFRRQCWEDVGGYLALSHGGVDTVAEITARMKGWRVQSFADLEVRHYRETGTATENCYAARFQDGFKAYALGYHPLFFLARILYRIPRRPLLLGAFLAGLGYACAVAIRQEREVSQELVAYLRGEQLRKLGLRTRSGG